MLLKCTGSTSHPFDSTWQRASVLEAISQLEQELAKKIPNRTSRKDPHDETVPTHPF